MHLVHLELIFPRCHRLDKDCVRSVSVRQRPARVEDQQSAAKVALLEHKIDKLASLLRSVNREPSSTNGLQVAGEQPQNDVDILSTTTSSTLRLNAESTLDNATSIQFAPYLPTPVSTGAYITNSPSSSEANGLLGIFRDKMLPSFGFIHIDPSMTAEQLREKRPLFFQAIMAVVTPDMELKLNMGAGFKSSIA